jgi:hypothetical protein
MHSGLLIGTLKVTGAAWLEQVESQPLKCTDLSDMEVPGAASQVREDEAVRRWCGKTRRQDSGGNQVRDLPRCERFHTSCL